MINLRKNPLSDLPLSNVFVTRSWQEEVEAHIKSIDELPIVLVGGTGIGKTAVVNALSKKMGCEIHTFVLSQMNDISDFLGYATKDKIGNITFSFLDVWKDIIYNNALFYNKYILKKPIQEEPKKFVLFFDEYNRAPNDIAFSIFSLFSDYRVKGLQLYPQVIRLIGSINPAGAYSTSQDDLAFKARVGYLVVDFNMESWTKWIEKSDYYYKDEFLEFITNRPTLFHKDTEADMNDYQGILTARTFTRFMNAVHYRNGISRELAIGIIGSKAVMELEGYIETKKSYTLQSIKNLSAFEKELSMLKSKKNTQQIEKILTDIAVNSKFDESSYPTLTNLLRLLIKLKLKEFLFSFLSKIDNNEFLKKRTIFDEFVKSLYYLMENPNHKKYLDITEEQYDKIVEDEMRKAKVTNKKIISNEEYEQIANNIKKIIIDNYAKEF